MWHTLKSSQRFKEEVEKWQSEGLITEEQAAKFIEKYDLDAPPPWYRRTSFILQAVALLLAAMGVFLLIAQNWDNLPVPLRTLMVLCPLLISYFVAWKNYSEGKESAAELAIFFASLLFGVNIALLAQIYHISAYYPDGVLWWILGTLPAIYFFRSNILAIVFQGLFIIWLGMQVGYEQFAFWGILLAGAFGLFLYRNPNSVHLFFALISSYLFLHNIFQLLLSNTHSYYYALNFFVLFANVYAILCLAILQFIKPQYDEKFITKLENTFSTGILFMLYCLTFENFTKEILERSYDSQAIIILCVFYGITLALWFLKNKTMPKDLLFNFVLVALFLSTTFFANSKDVYIFYTIVFNLVLLFYIGYKIYSGIAEQNKSKFMWGIGYLVVLALSRYIALFGDNYLFTALIFIACSLAIFGINKFWNNKFGEK